MVQGELNPWGTIVFDSSLGGGDLGLTAAIPSEFIYKWDDKLSHPLNP
jgi:hypothetical protein